MSVFFFIYETAELGAILVSAYVPENSSGSYS